MGLAGCRVNGKDPKVQGDNGGKIQMHTAPATLRKAERSNLATILFAAC